MSALPPAVLPTDMQSPPAARKMCQQSQCAAQLAALGSRAPLTMHEGHGVPAALTDQAAQTLHLLQQAAMAALLPASAAALHSRSPPMYSLFRLPTLCHMPASLLTAQQRRLCATAPVAAAAATAPPPPSAEQQFVSWPGLLAWRARGVDAATSWGPKGPVPLAAAPADALTPEAAAVAAAIAAHSPAVPASLAEAGVAVLQTPDPLGKAALTFAAWRAYCAGTLGVGAADAPQGPPARPPVPELVPVRRIPPMNASPLPKPVYMLHK